MLLAGRVRNQDEADIIQQVIETHMKRTVSPEVLFTLNENTSPTTRPILDMLLNNGEFIQIKENKYIQTQIQTCFCRYVSKLVFVITCEGKLP